MAIVRRDSALKFLSPTFLMIETKKDPHGKCRSFDLIIWSLLTFPGLIPVSSAVRGLTSLFEMGRGEHPSYRLHILIKVADLFVSFILPGFKGGKNFA